jgi:hypothetical protein
MLRPFARRRTRVPLSPERSGSSVRASIATARPGEPVTIVGRVVRITVEPANASAPARIVARVTDGSAEAALAFVREEAPPLSTGVHVVADGVFDGFGEPRPFDPILVTVLDRDR